MSTVARATGQAVDRLEGREKVSGQALYAADYRPEGLVHCVAIGATVARGRVRAVDDGAALALPGVLALLWHGDRPGLREVDDGELRLFQTDRVHYRGQLVGAIVAEELEVAREAAALVRFAYDEEPHDVELRAGHPRLYAPEAVNAGYPTDSVIGDVDAALAAAPVVVDATYTTPAYHNNPMEPHATTAAWDGARLTLWDSNQGVQPVQAAVATAFGLQPGQVRVVAPHVGGGFGSKGTPRPQVMLAAMAAQVVGRPVRLALTRHQLFAVVGYRTPTIQRLRLGCGRDGRLVAIAHEVAEQTSTVKEFAEQTAVATRHMYAAPNRRTTHRVVALDVPSPSWMRAPGECPGMYALESAIDELAVAAGLDPIELRVANEPEVHPEEGLPWSSRSLVACLREGAERFGWAERDPAPGVRRDGRWLVGTGVAASTYPVHRSGVGAVARAEPDGRFAVRIAAADIGTGARTVLAQIAADALGVGLDAVRLELGDSDFPAAGVAGGSSGTAKWGTAVVRACERLRERLAAEGPPGADGVEVAVDTADEVKGQAKLARAAFGAQFVEARVDVATGEVRVPRALGVFGVGRVINPKLARSQLVGGMTMGISMALFEEGVIDPRFGDYANHDLASYHVAACADIADVDAIWVDEDDDQLNPMGSKGIGEIGIVGTAAAVASAVHHATGIRVRDLPLRLDRLVGA